MKIIVAGGRDFKDLALLTKTLDTLGIGLGDTILSGCAQGADRLGEVFANARDISISKHPADLEQYGKRAGFVRNAEMASEAGVLVAFWDGKSKGTSSMISLAHKHNLLTRVVKYS
jgi:hypothetical protein